MRQHSTIEMRKMYYHALLISCLVVRVCQQIIAIIMQFNSIEFYHILHLLISKEKSKVNARVLLNKGVLSIKGSRTIIVTTLVK
jgi:hypothetical protein